MFAAYTTAPFSVPNGLTGGSRTERGLFSVPRVPASSSRAGQVSFLYGKLNFENEICSFGRQYIHLRITFDTLSMNILDEQTIYQATDEQILSEIHDRLVRMRRSCCFSQQELSELSGISIATIKRIESRKDKDISITVIIRLLRAMTQMEGIGLLVPEVPESPFLSRKGGKQPIRISNKTRRA